MDSTEWATKLEEFVQNIANEECEPWMRDEQGNSCIQLWPKNEDKWCWVCKASKLLSEKP